MPDHTIDELRAFHQFLGGKLHEESAQCSPEEALDEWRRQHPDARWRLMTSPLSKKLSPTWIREIVEFPLTNSTTSFATGTTCQNFHESDVVRSALP